MCSLVLSIFPYTCETWILSADLQIQTTEMRCFRNILHIPYKGHATNKEVLSKTQQAIGPCGKLKWDSHISRSSDLAKNILQLQGIMRGGRRRGRQKKRQENNVKKSGEGWSSQTHGGLWRTEKDGESWLQS